MRRLYRLLHDCQQMLAQGCQVHFMAQGGTESRHRASSIILAAIETVVDDGLEAMAQGVEERSDGQRRGNNDDWRLRGLPGELAHKRLETNYETDVDQGQQDRQRAIDQRAVDQHIDIP